jgi:hypothetical protein
MYIHYTIIDTIIHHIHHILTTSISNDAYIFYNIYISLYNIGGPTGIVNRLKLNDRSALDLPEQQTLRLKQMLAFLRCQDRTLVFSEFVSFLRLLERALSKELKGGVLFLHGGRYICVWCMVYGGEGAVYVYMCLYVCMYVYRFIYPPLTILYYSLYYSLSILCTTTLYDIWHMTYDIIYMIYDMHYALCTIHYILYTMHIGMAQPQREKAVRMWRKRTALGQKVIFLISLEAGTCTYTTYITYTHTLLHTLLNTL